MTHSIKETRAMNKFINRYNEKPSKLSATLHILSIFIVLGAMFFGSFVSAAEFDIDKHLTKTYVTIGAGYKFRESELTYKDENNEAYTWDDPYSARIEIGYYYNKNIKFGISHHSQWATGFPVNDDKNEYSKTEVFIDYTFTLK